MPESSDNGTWLLVGLIGGVIIGSLFTYLILQNRATQQLLQTQAMYQQIPPQKLLSPNIGNGLASVSHNWGEGGVPIINVYAYPYTNSSSPSNQPTPLPQIPDVISPSPKTATQEPSPQAQQAAIEQPVSTYKNKEETKYEWDADGNIIRKIRIRDAKVV
jgi:YD repeat-containing protein